jgi:hypothetical protein
VLLVIICHDTIHICDPASYLSIQPAFKDSQIVRHSHLAKCEIAVNVKVTNCENTPLFGYNGPVSELIDES